MGHETNFTLIVDKVGSFFIGIGVELDSNSNMDPDPLSKSGVVDSAGSSSKSSNSMGGVTDFSFHQFGGLEAGGGGAGCCDC